MVDRRPALIVRCSTAADVIAAVRYGREQGLEIGVRCGGHSVLGLPVTDGGLLIDLTVSAPAKLTRLAELKHRYDPDNVFHLNQNIHPEPGRSSRPPLDARTQADTPTEGSSS
jgi:FAD/FMN-containing dehydrogenase